MVSLEEWVGKNNTDKKLHLALRFQDILIVEVDMGQGGGYGWVRGQGGQNRAG